MAEYEKVIKDDISLHYEDQGVGHAIVLLHGFCGSHEYWKYVIDELEDRYRIIAVDLRGHGDSAVAENEFTIEDMADDVKVLLESLEIEEATVIGHSLGGYVALQLAKNNPALINGLGLVHSTPHSDNEEAKEGREKGKRRILDEGMENFLDDLVPKLFSPENLETHKGEVEFTKVLGLKTKPQGAIGALNAMKNRRDMIPFLKDYQGKLLLVAGENDQIIPKEKTFVKEGNHVTKRLLEDSGHMSMLEEPKQLIETIRDFIKSLD
ncbi:Dihydrolipoyllysine-residue acetyltransferase component of acetoin cleaving system [Bacillus sp. THAF10]|nr:Dihydrolipoyllysine-residue acetyltransferase component of acetoin cleaving system [Bacillus sp. THAF10]